MDQLTPEEELQLEKLTNKKLRREIKYLEESFESPYIFCVVMRTYRKIEGERPICETHLEMFEWEYDKDDRYDKDVVLKRATKYIEDNKDKCDYIEMYDMYPSLRDR